MPLIICKKRQAILDAPKHCLVLGGPGSGKTTLGLLKSLRWSEQLKPGQAILFLSFSKAAVARIGDAAREHLPPDKQGLLSIQTFHSFFWQLLQSHAYLLGSPRLLRVIPSHEDAALRNGITSEEELLWKEWEIRRRQLFFDEGRVCFDLFAPMAAELLRRCQRLSRRVSLRYPLIVVDEAQDTNEEQWACIGHLAETSRIVCLADPDQMIYGHLPGVTEERLPMIRKALAPTEVDLGGENNRSPGTDIAIFAKDLYQAKRTRQSYKGVSLQKFSAKAENRDRAIRSSLGLLARTIKTETGQPPRSVAILAAYSKGVAVVSGALHRGKPIMHQVLFDESFVLLSARVAAFLLEPKGKMASALEAAELLELAALAYQSKGNKTASVLQQKCRGHASDLRSGKGASTKLPKAATTILDNARTSKLTGEPRKDWLAVKALLGNSNEKAFADMAEGLDYLVAFGRGRRIEEGLSTAWMERGGYVDARSILDLALLQDQLLGGAREEGGIYVMNSHKAKGKQFDGVVLYRQQHHSPFVWRGEASPFKGSRTVLHMAITRARKHVLILSEAFPQCPLLRSHGLA